MPLAIAPSKDRLPRCLSCIGAAALLALHAAGAMAATPPTEAPAAPVEFNTDFMSPQTRSSIDLQRFERVTPLLPGSYRVDLHLNGTRLGPVDVTVKPGSDPDRGRICMTRKLLDQAALDWTQLEAPALRSLDDPAACATLEELAADSHAALDSGEMRLDLTLAQALLRRTPRGYVNPELWDSGVTGGTLNYSANFYRNDTQATGQVTHSGYVNLNAGFNAGDWHFRHNGTENWQSGPQGTGSQYQAINSYVEHDVPSIAGRVTIGDGNTSGRLFGTLPFRGLQLTSDDRMLPDSQRGYAPVIRGIAETNARVTVRQGTLLIYDMPVPPGPFVIDDLFPSGYGGDLAVTVTEGDGRARSFVVPYAAVPQLLRPGTQRYSVTAGTLRHAPLSSTPKLLEATYQRGIDNELTAYGGVQISDHYTAALGGVALGTSAGALSLDVTGSRAQLPDGSDASGASVRAGYSKLIEATRSNIAIAAYRFSTHGFMDLPTAMRTIDAVERGLPGDAIGRARSRLSATFNQPLGQASGQLFLSGYTQDYWDNRPRDVQYQFGYSNQFHAVSYSLSVARMRDVENHTDTRLLANMWVPLGTDPNAPNLGVNLTHDARGTATQTTLMGLAGDHRQWSYGASASHDSGGNTAGTVNGSYTGTKASASASYGAGRGYGNASMGVSGSLVAHPEGITLSAYSTDTVAVVSAPDAAGAHVFGYANVELDDSGHAVLPYLSPYRMNEVSIDPNGIPADVELKTTTQKVAPRAGSIVMVHYETSAGHAVLIDATQSSGAPLPFGADVLDGEDHSVGSVGQAGRIYARLPAQEAQLTVRWGQAKDQQCALNVSLPPASQNKDAAAGMAHLQLLCTAPSSYAQLPRNAQSLERQ
jgi:outer membrane usher protein